MSTRNGDTWGERESDDITDIIEKYLDPRFTALTISFARFRLK